MAIDYSRKGWIIKRLDETTERIPQMDGCFERVKPLNKKSLEEVVKTSIENLNNRFRDFKITVKSKSLFFGKRVEINGVHLDIVEGRSFRVKLTTGRIYVEIFGLDSATILNCLV